MIITQLQGGMGNQMFQYAFGRYLAIKHRTTLKLDTHYLLDRTPRKEFFVFRDYDLDIFDIETEIATTAEAHRATNWVPFKFFNRVIRHLFGRKAGHVFEPHFQFSEKAFNSGDNVYLEGFWQSEKYFASIKEVIKKDFTIKQPFSSQSTILADEISSCHSVCVNVRRADFVITQNHNTVSSSYYTEAEKVMLAKVTDPHFFVFSDEIDWCIANLSFSVPTTFVSHDYKGKKFQDYFRLMSLCKDFIIPNSSFAWWAVYLSESKEKTVIAPRLWFNNGADTSDLVPENWIRI